MDTEIFTPENTIMSTKKSFLITVFTFLGIFFITSSSFTRAASALDVVINEIAWMGTKASYNDEWLELYNTTDQDIDLSEWILKALDETPSINLSGIIKAHDYFLLERTDETTISNILADQIYTGSLGNEGEVLELYNEKNELIDKINASSGWFAGDNSTKATMERIDPQKDGSNSANWATNNTQVINGQDAAQNPILGTPKAQNSTYLTEEKVSEEEPQKPPSSPEPEPEVLPQKEIIYSQDIIINELLPNPVGLDQEEEWIELKNIGPSEINLEGWKIEDKSGKIYIISLDDFSTTIISGYSFFILERKITGIALNNTGGDSISFYLPNNNLLEMVSYQENAKEGLSYAKNQDQSWSWTNTPTKGKENIFTKEEKITEEETKSYKEQEEITPFKPEEKEEELLPQEENIKFSKKEIYSDKIIISELLPNPEGSDQEEFIELKNNDYKEVDLTDWAIGDKSGKKYTIKGEDFSSLIIPAQGYFVLPYLVTKITLNNLGDTVKLWQPNNILLDEVTYEKALEGAAYAREKDNIWDWTITSTPGKANIFNQEGAEEEEEEISLSEEKVVQEKSKKSDKLIITTLDKVREYNLGTRVQVEGLVSVEPGILGSTIFYLFGSGIQIYSYKKDFPSLSLGDLVQVTGTLSETRGEKRIKITSKDDIKFIAHLKPPKAKKVTVEEIDESQEGFLVEIEGEILEIKGQYIWLDDGTGEVKIYLKTGAEIDLSQFKVKDQLQVIGIVSQSGTEYRLLPRYQEDLKIISKEIKGAKETKIESENKKKEITKYLLATLGALAVLLVGLIFKKRLGERFKK